MVQPPSAVFPDLLVLVFLGIETMGASSPGVLSDGILGILGIIQVKEVGILLVVFETTIR